MVESNQTTTICDHRFEMKKSFWYYVIRKFQKGNLFESENPSISDNKPENLIEKFCF